MIRGAPEMRCPARALVLESSRIRGLELHCMRIMMRLSSAVRALTASGVLVVAAGSCTEPVAPGGSGVVLWRVPSGATELPLVPAANADRSMIYFGTPDHRIKKVRASDGQVLWDSPIGVSQV